MEASNRILHPREVYLEQRNPRRLASLPLVSALEVPPTNNTAATGTTGGIVWRTAESAAIDWIWWCYWWTLWQQAGYGRPVWADAATATTTTVDYGWIRIWGCPALAIQEVDYLEPSQQQRQEVSLEISEAITRPSRQEATVYSATISLILLTHWEVRLVGGLFGSNQTGQLGGGWDSLAAPISRPIMPIQEEDYSGHLRWVHRQGGGFSFGGAEH